MHFFSNYTKEVEYTFILIYQRLLFVSVLQIFVLPASQLWDVPHNQNGLNDSFATPIKITTCPYAVTYIMLLGQVITFSLHGKDKSKQNLINNCLLVLVVGGAMHSKHPSIQ